MHERSALLGRLRHTDLESNGEGWRGRGKREAAALRDDSTITIKFRDAIASKGRLKGDPVWPSPNARSRMRPSDDSRSAILQKRHRSLHFAGDVAHPQRIELLEAFSGFMDSIDQRSMTDLK